MRGSGSRHKTLITAVLCVSLVAQARFLFSSQFGLYEDDYTRIPQALATPLPDILHEISSSIAGFQNHGKPLHSALIYSLAAIGSAIGGLRGMYLVAFLVVSLNALLFFLLLRRTTGEVYTALGAISYTLFSADTSQSFLTHAFGLQSSLTLLLLAFHAYLSGRRILAYALAAALLLNYEVPFPVFLTAPLMMRGKWTKDTLRSLRTHAFALFAMLLSLLLIRRALGEDRVSSLSLSEAFRTPLLHMVQGPVVALGSYIIRPLQAIRDLPPSIYMMLLPVFVILVLGIKRIAVPPRASPAWRRRSFGKVSTWNGGRSLLPILTQDNSTRLLLLGLSMVILAYPLTFTVRAYAISGRDTRVHLAAGLGAATLLGWAAGRVFESLQREWARWAVSGALAVIFSLHVGFGILVQLDYVHAWALQRELWSSLVRLAPDLEDGTVILVDPSGLEDTTYIDANTWSLRRVLPQLYSFPAEWKSPPRAYRLLEDWKERSLWNSKELKAVDFEWNYIISDWSDTILLVTHKNQVVERSYSIQLGGETFSLKPSESMGAAKYIPTPLYALLGL